MQSDPRTNAARSLSICYLFESEILVWLLLRNWNHPFADDSEYRNDLLESTTELLTTASTQGNQESYIEGMSDRDMNFIAALWYSEFMSLQHADTERSQEADDRRRWLSEVRQTLPSCFCAVDDLGPN